MTIEGVDYSFARPGGAALKAAGKVFAVRYLEYSHATAASAAKFLTAGEIADLHGHGLAVVACLESTTTRALSGAAAGMADGTDARVAMERLGFPAACPVYFAVDFNASLAQQPAIDAYLRATAAALGPGRTGLYAGGNVLRRAAASGSAQWFWNAAATSWGSLYGGSALWQYLNGQNINGLVDLTRALRANYGQWAALTLPSTDTGADVTFENTLTPFVADFTPGATLYTDEARTISDSAGWPGGTTIGVAGVGTARGTFPDLPVLVNLPNGTLRKLVYVGANHIVPGTLKVRPGYFESVVPVGFTQAQLDEAVAAQKSADAAALAALQASLGTSNAALEAANSKVAQAKTLGGEIEAL